MATRIVSRRLGQSLAAAAMATGIAAYSRPTLHAEPPPSETKTKTIIPRKPIYSSDETTPSYRAPLRKPSSQSSSTSTTTTTKAPSSSPSDHNIPYSRETPTTLLAAQIRFIRVHLALGASKAEATINTLSSHLLRTERSLTSTLLSLPSPHEPLLPSSLYVLVATLTGTIITRNRNILFRSTVPLGLGIGMAWVVIPRTMRNVSQLVAEVEEGWSPEVRKGHVRVVEGVKGAVGRTGELAGEGIRAARGAVKGAREGVEGWVQGKKEGK